MKTIDLERWKRSEADSYRMEYLRHLHVGSVGIHGSTQLDSRTHGGPLT